MIETKMHMTNKWYEQLTDLSTECVSLKSQLTYTQEEISILKSEDSELKETNDNLTNQNSLLEETIQQISGKLNTFKDLSDEFAEINSKNIGLKNQIKNLQQQIKNYESENKKLHQQIDEYKLKLVQNDFNNQSKSKLIENYKKTQLQQSLKIQELQDEIQILKTQLTQLQQPYCDEIDNRQFVSAAYLPALNIDKTLHISSTKTKLLSTPKISRNVNTEYYNMPTLYIATYNSQTSVISVDNDSGNELMSAQDVAEILQQKDVEYKELLEEKLKIAEEIEKLKETYCTDTVSTEIIEMKKEKKKSKDEFCSCFFSSWIF
eukprot:268188_1